MTAMDTCDVDTLFSTLRRAAPFAELGRDASSKASSTCCRAATRPTTSPSFGLASPGIARPDAVAAREGAKRVAVDQRRHDSGSRPLRCVSCSGAAPAPRASASSTRKWCFESTRRRDVRARRIVVADCRDHARSRARDAGSRRARQRCRSGKAIARAGLSNSDSPSAA